MDILSPRGSEAPEVNTYMCICQLNSVCNYDLEVMLAEQTKRCRILFLYSIYNKDQVQDQASGSSWEFITQHYS